MGPSFIKEFDGVVENKAWICVTCEKIAKHLGSDDKPVADFVVGKSCCLGCHIGHEIEVKNVNGVKYFGVTFFTCNTQIL